MAGLNMEFMKYKFIQIQLYDKRNPTLLRRVPFMCI